jgi:hypothetical protein
VAALVSLSIPSAVGHEAHAFGGPAFGFKDH